MSGTVKGKEYIGAIAGISFGKIINCQAKADVDGINNMVGGIVGFYNTNEGFKNCNFIGKVKGASYVGGISGFSYGQNVENCYTNADVEGTGDKVGGLIGDSRGNVLNSYVTGNVKGKSEIGGLIGASYGIQVTNCNSRSNIISTGNNVGGLIGENHSELTNSYANIEIKGNDNVGGLVGESMGGISECYATGKIEGINNVGGLIGITSGGGPLLKSYSLCEIKGNNVIGGLIGNANILIELCYVKNNIIGNDNIGGLVGQENGARISKSYSLGDISGKNNVGGILGYGGGSNISNCYSMKNITATGSYIGGIVGYWYGDDLLNVYSVSAFFEISNVGGVIGGPEYSGPPATSAYWDTTISGVLTSAGGTDVKGKTTNELKQQSTYINWDFTSIWNISADKNEGYPYIQELENTI